MVKKLRGLVLLVSLCVFMSGCSATMNAIDNSEMSTDVKTSESIFLNVSELMDARNDNGGVYIRVTNTSEQSGFDLSHKLKSKIANMGYRVLSTPEGASLLLQVNLLYLGEKKPGMDLTGLVSGAVGGAMLAGSIAALANAPDSHVLGYAGAGSLIGTAVNYSVKKAWSVDEFYGVVDIQIKEFCLTKEDEKEHKNRIAVMAKQTNLDIQEALPVLSRQITNQISGMFKL